MLEPHPLGTMGPHGSSLSLPAVHLITEASRLAYADRALYVADPDFLPVPVRGLIDPLYLAKRARLISPERAMARATAGEVGQSGGALAPDPDADALRLATTHISIVDGDGNAVAFTTTIETAFGSGLFVRGFLLNNQMTDFAGVPAVGGQRVANRVAPGKRPRSSMTPTLVFDASGRLVLVAGSPGGTRIIGFVTNALIAALDWKMDPQAAAALPHFGNRNGPTELEQGTAAAELKAGLESMGHHVELDSMISGLAIIRVAPGRLSGGADPRREDTALGD
jgi:gamma-glutamyltranspeptidase / glutathione hydrolase